jgi:hypothetical protein
MTGVALPIMDGLEDPPFKEEMAGRPGLLACVKRFATADPDHARDIVRTCHS